MADNMEIIECPACGSKMEKIYMEAQGINLDVCLECGGIYFDNREFKKFDEITEDITPLVELFENKTFKQTEQYENRKCPVCGAQMVKNYSSAKKDVEVDECYSCGGKFLDNGELEKIREEYPTEEARAADVIKELYSAVGSEIIEQQKEYIRQMSKPSILTKLIRMRKFY